MVNTMARLPLDTMTKDEKLQALEELWEDLRRRPADVPSPNWHGDVLQARKARIDAGDAEFVSFEAAINRLYARLN